MYGFVDKIINPLWIRKADLHLRRVDIDVGILRGHGEIDNGKRKPMLHEIRAVSLLQRLREDIALENSAVYEENLVAATGSCKFRTTQKAVNRKRTVFGGLCNGDHGTRLLPTENAVNELLDVAVSGRMKLLLSIDPVMEGNLRMGKRQMLHQIGYRAGLCLGRLQKFAPHGNIAEKVAHDDAGAVRCAYLGNLQRGFLRINGFRRMQHVIDRTDSDQLLSCLGDHFHSGNGGNGGQRLTAKAKT